MRVRCKANTGKAIPESYVDAVGGYGRETILPITVGAQYQVFALTMRGGGVWYYVLDDQRVGFPVWFPAPLFDVVDPRLSRFWVFGFVDEGVRDGDAVLAVREWAQDPFGYYDRLSDGEPEATATFNAYRELMELEFDAVDEQAVGEDLGDGWILCPRCREAWKTTAAGAMIRCPACNRTLKNPRMLGKA